MTGVQTCALPIYKPDLTHEGNKYKFTPNTITYAAPEDSAQGRKIAASKMGFVVHTKYKGKKLADMKAGFDVDHSKFKQDPDVNLVNPEVSDFSKAKYTKAQQSEYQKHKQKATEAFGGMNPDTLDKLQAHDAYIKPILIKQ